MGAAKKRPAVAENADLAESIGSGIASVAQALINIAEGHTTIEKGSQLYEGMELLMRPEVAAVMRAAPDLLAALENLLTYATKADSNGVKRARAALAKARGES